MKKVFSLTSPIPQELLEEMKNLHQNIRERYTNYKSCRESIKEFYGKIADYEIWRSIVLTTIYMEANCLDRDLQEFGEDVKNFYYSLPRYPAGRERQMEAYYFIQDAILPLAHSIRKQVVQALNEIVEKAIELKSNVLVETTLHLESLLLRDCISPENLEKIILKTKFPELIRWKAYVIRSSRNSFESKLSSKDLRQLCIDGKLKLVHYFAALARRFRDNRNDDFYSALESFMETTDADFDPKSLGSMKVIQNAFRYLALENGMNVGYGIVNASSGLGLLLGVYEKCCETGKEIIFHAVEEIQVTGLEKSGDDYIVSVPAVGSVRKLAKEEITFFEAILAKNHKKEYS
jgi:hypothetical protein